MIAATIPNSSVLTATSRSIAKPNVIGSPFARTTRMPTAMRPSVLPFVRAIRAGAYSSAMIDTQMIARNRPTTIDIQPASSPAKNPSEKGAVIAISSSRPPTPTITESINAAPTRDHQPAST